MWKRLLCALLLIVCLVNAQAQDSQQEVLEQQIISSIRLVQLAIDSNLYPELNSDFIRVRDRLDQMDIKIASSERCDGRWSGVYNHLLGATMCESVIGSPLAIPVLIHESAHGNFLFPRECEVEKLTVRIIAAASFMGANVRPSTILESYCEESHVEDDVMSFYLSFYRRFRNN